MASIENDISDTAEALSTEGEQTTVLLSGSKNNPLVSDDNKVKISDLGKKVLITNDMPNIADLLYY